jgi:MerR family transcriptional regulator, light-induced transcriptional regulator
MPALDLPPGAPPRGKAILIGRPFSRDWETVLEVRQKARDFILEHQQDLARKIVDRQWQLQPSLESRYGKKAQPRCLEDACYHVKYLSEAVGAGKIELFANYVNWAKTMLASRRIPVEDLRLNLATMLDVIKAEMPLSMQVNVVEYMESAIHSLDSGKAESCAPQPERALTDLAARYLKALLQYDRNGASELILAAVNNKVAIKEIYSQVFEPSQHEIGRLWQMNELSIAQEHYCTASTQFIMSQLYPFIFRSDRPSKGTIVAACVSGELHELGARMLCDVLEMEGWNTIYLGANVPSTGVVEVLKANGCDILALSASMTFHLSAVREVVGSVHAELPKARILVGGYAFGIAPELWRDVGADYWARNAADAVGLIASLSGPQAVTSI